MKTSPNTNEERLPRASIELLPERYAVVARTVNLTCRIAYTEWVARRPLQETVTKDMSDGEPQPQPVKEVVQLEEPEFEAEVSVPTEETPTLSVDSTRCQVFDVYEDAS